MNNGFYIFQTSDSDQVWVLPVRLMNLLGLSDNDKVNLRCGSVMLKARVSQLLARDNRMGLSADIMKSFGITPGTVLHIKPEGKKDFRLGPVIGILAFNKIVTDRKFNYYRRFAVINKDNGVIYVFSGRDMNPQNRTTIGYRYDYAADKWVRGSFPFPDVVIDRCYPSNRVYHSILQETPGIKVFNKKTRIDKIEFYKAMSADESLKSHIPDTRELESISDLKRFLDYYGEVYLKPVNSMKGFGIIMARYAKPGLLGCSYLKNGRIITVRLPMLNDIFNVIEDVVGCQRPYLVQQAIPSMEYDTGVFSIRTWAMKNGKGEWVMPGMDARGTFGRGFLTNISAGAKPVPLKELFRVVVQKGPYNKDQLVIMLEDLTLRTAELLDKQYGPLGVLGLDIMIDQAGKLWLIEANANPGRSNILAQSEYFSWSTRVYQYQLAYAAFLAGFGPLEKQKKILPRPVRYLLNRKVKKPVPGRSSKERLIVADKPGAETELVVEVKLRPELEAGRECQVSVSARPISPSPSS